MINKGKIFAIIIVVAIIIALIAAVAAAPKNKQQTNQTPGTKVCSIIADVGVSTISINNLNTGGGVIVITAANLPYSFNFTVGDRITFNATVESGYIFNAWIFNTGTWDRHNPLTLTLNNRLELTATVLSQSDYP